MHTCILKQSVCKGAFAVVHMRNDAEVAYALNREVGKVWNFSIFLCL
jgi:hypothetical protein